MDTTTTKTTTNRTNVRTGTITWRMSKEDFSEYFLTSLEYSETERQQILSNVHDEDCVELEVVLNSLCCNEGEYNVVWHWDEINLHGTKRQIIFC